MVKIKTRYGEVREGTWKEFYEEHNFILMHGIQKKPEPAISPKGFGLADAERRFREQAGAPLLEDNRTPEQKLATVIGQEVNKQLKPLVDEIKQQQAQVVQSRTQTPTKDTTRHHSVFMSDDDFEKLYGWGKYSRSAQAVNQAAKSVKHAAAPGKFSHAVGPAMSCRKS